ncbi:MAG: hypothetical protein IAI48_05380 [Candidatus Eremiobacteraeota bacterium]|nr:hypothetical protein [Candidatus Eremiobacteraeota bacterium]
MIARRLGTVGAAIALLVSSLCVARVPAGAAISTADRRVLEAYLDAIERERYASAFTLLAAKDRRYFGSAIHFASVFTADAFSLAGYRIVRSQATSLGTVALVAERISFRDAAHDARANAAANVPYGIVRSEGRAAIHDPGHPWRASRAEHLGAGTGGVRISVRKVSFFTGRVEMVLTFENASAAAVTILPYALSRLIDDRGRSYRPLATRSRALTDATLYVGLKLPAGARYTGFIAFETPERFEPGSLRATVGPALAAGSSAPFTIALPAFDPNSTVLK